MCVDGRFSKIRSQIVMDGIPLTAMLRGLTADAAQHFAICY